jgi:hypothetical protein
VGSGGRVRDGEVHVLSCRCHQWDCLRRRMLVPWVALGTPTLKEQEKVRHSRDSIEKVTDIVGALPLGSPQIHIGDLRRICIGRDRPRFHAGKRTVLR